jgi:glycosyltransferase involved in cell wall biosynthesis
MNEQFLSVAMCTYNGAGFLAEQLESIASHSQTTVIGLGLQDSSSDDERDYGT